MATTRLINKESLEAAKRDRSHPLISIYDSLGKRHWKEFADTVRAAPLPERDAISRRLVVPFSHALRGKQFTMEPLDYASVWSHVMETFDMGLAEDNSARTNIAAVIAYTYGAMHLPAHMQRMEPASFDNFDAMVGLFSSDKPSSTIFNDRLKEMHGKVNELRSYEDIKQDPLIIMVADNFNNAMCGFTLAVGFVLYPTNAT